MNFRRGCTIHRSQIICRLEPGVSFPKMRKLSLRDVHFEGDQACWRRLVSDWHHHILCFPHLDLSKICMAGIIFAPTWQIKSCPNLEILSLQNIRLNDAVKSSLYLSQYTIHFWLNQDFVLRTWRTYWPSQECQNWKRSTSLPQEPQSWRNSDDYFGGHEILP